jgi:hypothetical protein
VVAAERLEECSVTVIVTASQDEALALDVLLHEFKELTHFMISLFLAVANIGEGEKRLGAGESAGKLGQGGIVGNRESTGSMKSPGESLDTKDDVHKNAVDVGELWVFVEVSLKLLMQLVSSLSAALLPTGNKVLPKDSPIPVNNDKGKGGSFLDGVTNMMGNGRMRDRSDPWGLRWLQGPDTDIISTPGLGTRGGPGWNGPWILGGRRAGT